MAGRTRRCNCKNVTFPPSLLELSRCGVICCWSIFYWKIAFLTECDGGGLELVQKVLMMKGKLCTMACERYNLNEV